MSSILSQYVLYIVLYAVYVLAAYLSGKVLSKLLFKAADFSFIQNVFLNVLFGDTLIITIYSLIKCHLLTINVVIAVAIVTTILIKKLLGNSSTQVQKDSAPQTGNVLLLLLIVVVPFIIRALVYYNYSYHIANIPHYDHQYYISVAETIKQSGVENFFSGRTLLFDQFKMPSPYRYHDIWLTTLFIEFNLSSIAIYHLFVSSFTILLSLLGVLALFETYSKNTWITVILSALFLFVGYSYFHIGNIFIDTQNPIEYQKLGISYALLSAAILFYLKNQIHNVILTVCILFAYSVAALPLIIAIGLILFVALVKKRINAMQFIWYCVPLILSFLLFVIFYKFFGYKDLGLSFSLPPIKTILFAAKGLVIKSFARFWMVYIWFVLAILLIRYAMQELKSLYTLGLIILFIIFFCIGFQSLMVDYSDPNQFATNNTIPLLQVLFYIIAVKLILIVDRKAMKFKLLFAAMSILLLASAYLTYSNKHGFYNSNRIASYDKEYIKSVQALSSGIHNRIGLFWVDTGYYVNTNRMKEYFIRPGEYLKVMGNDFDLVNLAPNMIPVKDKAAKSTIRQLSFMIFKNQNNNSILDDITLKLKFIKQFKFEYIVLGKNAVLPDTINKLITKRVQDPKSGETFCLLNIQ